MATLDLSSLDGAGLLEPSDLGTLLQEISSDGSGSFLLEGSLLDHMIDEYPPVLHFEPADDGFDYEFDVEWPTSFPDEKRAEQRNRIRDAFLRGGLVRHPNLDQVVSELRNQDDVILGIDEDILRDCIVTSTLLEEIYAETFPNWILIGIPRLVMSGIESAAKDEFTEGNHPRVGWPTYQGRVGQRALQEVMDLRRENPDRPGLAMMTVGELQKETGEHGRNDWKVDALVRDQFKQFLDDIGFHKGTFFLSQNRVNVMMSGTEGGDALYLQKPEFSTIERGSVSVDGFADLIYELCVQFGSVRISDPDGDDVVELSVYWPGKQVSDWEERRLNVVSEDK